MQGEPLWDYIWCFSQKCHKLPSVANADVVSAFWDGMTCRSLVHELSYEKPQNTKDLPDITTRQASGKAAVRATFTQGNARMATSSGRVTPTKSTIKETKKGARGGKMVKNIDHITSLHWPATTRSGRIPTTPMMSLWQWSNAISSDEPNGPKITSRRSLKQPVRTTRTPSSTSSGTTP
jgi:hypothetical protein